MFPSLCSFMEFLSIFSGHQPAWLQAWPRNAWWLLCVDRHPSQTHRQLASAHRALFWKLTILAESQYWLANLFSLWWALLWTLYFSLPVSRAQQQRQLSHVFRNEMNNVSSKYFNLVYHKKYFKCFTMMMMTVMITDCIYFYILLP